MQAKLSRVTLFLSGVLGGGGLISLYYVIRIRPLEGWTGLEGTGWIALSSAMIAYSLFHLVTVLAGWAE